MEINSLFETPAKHIANRSTVANAAVMNPSWTCPYHKIHNLINILNKDLKRKIKVKYENKSTNVNFNNNLRVLPKWKQVKNLKNKILIAFKDEINKN